MAINFCRHVYRPAIRCDSVGVDGYEVENSVASDRRPFLAASFVKPPVNIYVSFPCSVDVSHIEIRSSHGAQRSVGFEIFTHSGRIASSWLLDDGDVTVPSHIPSSVFTCVGKAYQPDCTLFRFTNARYRTRSPWVGDPVDPGVPLTHRHARSLSCVSDVCVRVVRAARASVCAVGALEIWGQPAFACPPRVVTRLLRLRDHPPGGATATRITDSLVSPVPIPDAADATVPSRIPRRHHVGADVAADDAPVRPLRRSLDRRASRPRGATLGSRTQRSLHRRDLRQRPRPRLQRAAQSAHRLLSLAVLGRRCRSAERTDSWRSATRPGWRYRLTTPARPQGQGRIRYERELYDGRRRHKAQTGRRLVNRCVVIGRRTDHRGDVVLRGAYQRIVRFVS